MKVEILTNLGSIDFPDAPFLEGQIQEVAEPLGSRLIARRVARLVPEPEPMADKFEAMRAENISPPKNKNSK